MSLNLNITLNLHRSRHWFFSHPGRHATRAVDLGCFVAIATIVVVAFGLNVFARVPSVSIYKRIHIDFEINS